MKKAVSIMKVNGKRIRRTAMVAILFIMVVVMKVIGTVTYNMATENQ